jgi:hypothetical protein
MSINPNFDKSNINNKNKQKLPNIKQENNNNMPMHYNNSNLNLNQNLNHINKINPDITDVNSKKKLPPILNQVKNSNINDPNNNNININLIPSSSTSNSLRNSRNSNDSSISISIKSNQLRTKSERSQSQNQNQSQINNHSNIPSPKRNSDNIYVHGKLLPMKIVEQIRLIENECRLAIINAKKEWNLQNPIAEQLLVKRIKKQFKKRIEKILSDF